MTNSEITERFNHMKSVIHEIEVGLKNNLFAKEWYSSQKFHEDTLKKLEAIKIISSL